MNSKRQTIWLVSMLSLMVVLSAYYLFSEDVNKLDLNAEGTMLEDINVINEISGHEHPGEAAPEVVTDVDGEPAEGTEGEQTPQTDQEVISRLESQQASGEEYFAAMAIQRTEEFSKQWDELMTIADSKEKSDAEVGEALEKIQNLESKIAKLDNIESILSQSYAQAVVLEDNNKWKVVVQSDKLEKSEAVSIADLVMEEMNIGAEKLQIQVIQ